MNLEGELGYKGARGYSAYEIAVQHGYTGTEEQWSEDFLNAENYYDKTEMNNLLDEKADDNDLLNYYDKTEINSLLANYELKGNFAIITGTQSTTSLNMLFDFPTGFNQNNCIVIGCMVKRKNDTYWRGFNLQEVNNEQTPGVTYAFTPSKINLVDLIAYYNNLFPLDYRIVLMKIGE